MQFGDRFQTGDDVRTLFFAGSVKDNTLGFPMPITCALADSLFRIFRDEFFDPLPLSSCYVYRVLKCPNTLRTSTVYGKVSIDTGVYS